jgi:uncharacterized protein with GYD domain
MRTFVILASFTEQGLRMLKETTERVRAFCGMAAEQGIKVKDLYWTRGVYDIIAVVDAPDEEEVTALCTAVDARGNVRTRTMRAFPMEHMEEMFAKMKKAEASSRPAAT